MRYRRLSIQYARRVAHGQGWPLGETWQIDRLRVLVQPGWRPDLDVYETAGSLELVLDLAGIEEDDVDIQLFEDALVVEGRRHIPVSAPGARYHVAGIRQGPFRVEIALPAPVDAEHVQASYDRGLLRVSLPRREESR
jgi:HSP20 family protein